MILCEYVVPKRRFDAPNVRKFDRNIKLLNDIKEDMTKNIISAGLTVEQCDLHVLDLGNALRFVATPLGQKPQ